MILIRTCSGLCNRLRTMAAGIKLAREVGKKCHIFWRIDGDMNTRFTDLFLVPDGMVVHESSPESLFSRALFSHKNGFATVPDERDLFVAHVFRNQGKGFLAHTDFEDFCHSMDYQWLRPLPSVQDQIDEQKVSLGMTGGGAIGLHIRRTDNEMSILYSPLSLFEDKIKMELEKNSEQRFFLATDDKETKQELKRKFGDKILTRQDVSRRSDERGVFDATIDLFLLASCKKLYGSYWSSFSETAAYIGHMPFEQLKKEATDAK